MGRMILFLLVGLGAGWVASQLMKGKSLGLATNLFIGVVGSLLGGFLFGLVGIHAYGFIGSFILAVVGSLTLLSVMTTMKRKL